MDPDGGSAALDNWDFRVPFARFHIQWEEADGQPAFEQGQAVAIAIQELHLEKSMDILGHRAVLVSFSCERIQVGERLAQQEPAWVVMIGGEKRVEAIPAQDFLTGIAPGGGTVIQVLIHARTGELLLGIAVPVSLQRRE